MCQLISHMYYCIGAIQNFWLLTLQINDKFIWLLALKILVLLLNLILRSYLEHRMYDYYHEKTVSPVKLWNFNCRYKVSSNLRIELVIALKCIFLCVVFKLNYILYAKRKKKSKGVTKLNLIIRYSIILFTSLELELFHLLRILLDKSHHSSDESKLYVQGVQN